MSTKSYGSDAPPPDTITNIFYGCFDGGGTLGCDLVRSALELFSSPPTAPKLSICNEYSSKIDAIYKSVKAREQPGERPSTNRTFLLSLFSEKSDYKATTPNGVGPQGQGQEGEAASLLPSLTHRIMDLSVGVFGATSSFLSLPFRLLSSLLSREVPAAQLLSSVPCPPNGFIYLGQCILTDLTLCLTLVLCHSVRGKENTFYDAVSSMTDDRHYRKSDAVAAPVRRTPDALQVAESGTFINQRQDSPSTKRGRATAPK